MPLALKWARSRCATLPGLDIGWSKGAQTDNPIRDALCELGPSRPERPKLDFMTTTKPPPDPVGGDAAYHRDITGREALRWRRTKSESCIYPDDQRGRQNPGGEQGAAPSDVDVVWLNGYGWPADKGGPMFYGDMVGAQRRVWSDGDSGRRRCRVCPRRNIAQISRSGGKFTDIDTGGLKV